MPLSSHLRAVLLDIDGTVCWKGSALPGAAEAIQELRDQDLKLLFLTNTDSMTVADVVTLLLEMGLRADASEIFTPVVALQAFLAENPERRCYFLASPRLMPFLAHGGAGQDADVDFVVVADPRENASAENLDAALQHLMAGAELIGLHRNRYHLRADGYHLDTGAYIEMLEYASGRGARILGKPSRDFFDAALALLSEQPCTATIVGDDATADIAGGKAAGLATIQVRTGKYQQTPPADADQKADVLIDSIADLPPALSAIPVPAQNSR